jgi:hypothetical protein
MTPARIDDPNVAQDDASLAAPIVTDPKHAGKLRVRNALYVPSGFRYASLRCRKWSGIRNSLTGVL